MRRALPPILLCALTLAGCTFGRSVPRGPVRVTVTRDFGATGLRTATGTVPTRGESAAAFTRRLLGLRSAIHPQQSPVSVAGLTAPAGYAWTLFVNGIAGPLAPAQTQIHPGDRVWWDLHRTGSGARLRGVVGAFPEPFVHGTGGKRLPATLECAADVAASCRRVERALTAIGVPSTSQVIGTGSGNDTLGVEVGTIRDLRAQVVTALIANGPGASGVFARFPPTGTALELLDPAGRTVRTLTTAAGLIAATGDQVSEPTWLVTGTDVAGVAAAARLFGTAALRDRYALAVGPSGPVGLPVTP